jgi:hypothetical protein
MDFPADHPRGPNGGPMFLGEELCPICQCCSLGSESCDNCGGEGYVDTDSPEGWDEGDTEPCDYCEGHGGYLTCLGGCNLDTKEKHGSLRELPAVRTGEAT